MIPGRSFLALLVGACACGMSLALFQAPMWVGMVVTGLYVFVGLLAVALAASPPRKRR